MSVYWLSFATRTPPQFFSQQELFQMAGYPNFPEGDRRRYQALFRSAGIDQRAMWFNPSDYKPSEDPNDFHSRYVSGVREIAPKVAKDALQKAGLKASDIDFLVFSSCTGYTCPGFSAELATTLGVSENRPTANLLGMGCSALVPSIERAWDHLMARPGSRALVISVEICSATYWIDQDLETATGNALFGDGSAAIVLSSCKEDFAEMSRSQKVVGQIEGFHTLRDGRFLSDMGFQQKDGRLRVRLAREIPERIVPMVVQMIQQLELSSEHRLALHPGGRKILEALGRALGALSAGWEKPLKWSRSVLKDFGNMSSPTAAFVLQRSMEENPPQVGEIGGMITMGPGLSVEGMRMRWIG
jgi:predicted naringenin-chalcone synthase